MPSGGFFLRMAHTLAALEETIGQTLNSAWGSIPKGFGHFLDARKILRGSISKESTIKCAAVIFASGS